MRIVLAGGGSGGHVTPLKAIYDVLRQEQPSAEVIVMTDTGFRGRTTEIFAEDQVTVRTVLSGKYRRYHSKSLLWHLTHIPTLLANLRDLFLLGFGTLQMIVRFLLQRPDVVFCKGGFACVPVGIAARLYRVPLIIHDSDTRPGLTNRILSRWAHTIATGMPPEFYPYPKQKVIYTGIPVKAAFRPVGTRQQEEYKKELGLAPQRRLLLVTGGGNGSLPVNIKLSQGAQQLLEDDWSIVLLAGHGKAKTALSARAGLPKKLQQQWQIEEFADMTPRLLAADVIVARSSASTIQECANAQKTVVGIPSPHLDDQKQNADFFERESAIIALDETALSDDGKDFVAAVERAALNTALATQLHTKFAKPSASQEIARLIVRQV